MAKSKTKAISAILQLECRLAYHFARAFKVTTGLSPYQYVLRCRLELAQKLLQNQKRELAQVAAEAGFGNQSHMTSVFQRMLHTTPKRYQQKMSSITASGRIERSTI
ncbi:helix-turn-helix transcriptional regulator [Nostoc sp. TCL240-02]|nr:helix-turn-helix transcriptional regulator [Nostoc sp. TCL240-02]